MGCHAAPAFAEGASAGQHASGNPLVAQGWPVGHAGTGHRLLGVPVWDTSGQVPVVVKVEASELTVVEGNPCGLASCCDYEAAVEDIASEHGDLGCTVAAFASPLLYWV